MYDEGIAKRNGENLNIECLLMSVSKNSAKRNIIYHYHKYMELIYMLEGSMYAYIGDKTFTVNTDCLIMVYPNEPHEYSMIEDSRYIVIKFFTDILKTPEQSFHEFEYIFNLNADNMRTRLFPDARSIKGSLEDSLLKFTEDGYTSELYIRSNILRVCAYILDMWKDNDEIVPIEKTITRSNLEIIKSITEYAKSVNGTLKTHEAATLANMSDGHFSRIFKSAIGMTFSQYVKNIKCIQAERLLKCTDMSVTQIAQELGYATTSHFIEDFKKEKQLSPKRYRSEASKTPPIYVHNGAVAK